MSGSPRWRGCFAFLALAAATCAAPAAHAFCVNKACAGGLCELDAQGCPTGGVPLKWASRCVGYSFNPDVGSLPEAEVRAAVDAAFATWSGVDCPGGGQASIAFVPLADVACPDAEYNQGAGNANAIIFLEPWPFQSASLEIPTVVFDQDTGEIFDADVQVDATMVTLDGTGLDLQAVVTHAAGHMLGLGHSADESATMFNGLEPGTIEGRALGADDVAGVCAMYPPGRDAPCAPEPRGGFSSECGGAAPEGSASGASAGSGAPGDERRIDGCACGAAGAPARGGGGAAPLAALVLLAGVGAWASRRERIHLGSLRS